MDRCWGSCLESVIILCFSLFMTGCGCERGVTFVGDAIEAEQNRPEVEGEDLSADDAAPDELEEVIVEAPDDEPDAQDIREEEPIEPPPRYWSKTYGTPDYEWATAVVQTPDADFVVLGTIYLADSDTSDILLVKINGAGEVLWAKILGSSGDDVVNDMKETSDGGLIIAGRTGIPFTEPFYGYDTDYLVIRLDEGGNIIWQRAYGYDVSRITYDVAFMVSQASDGGFIIVGTGGEGYSPLWILKIDDSGSVEWQSHNSSVGDVSDISLTNDSGYILTGVLVSWPNDLVDRWVMKLDAHGIVIWYKAFQMINPYEYGSITQVSDGGYVAAWSRYDDESEQGTVVFVKMDENGNVLWIIEYRTEGDIAVRSTCNTADGAITASGATYAMDFILPVAAWILKMDEDGSVLWWRAYGGEQDDEAVSVLQAQDGSLVVAGSTGSFIFEETDLWLIKMENEGSIADDCPPGFGVDYSWESEALALTPIDFLPEFDDTSSVGEDIDLSIVDISLTVETQCSR